MKIGITGGIGCGKSYICRRLATMGIQVYDCDSAAKRIIRTSAEIRNALTQLVGPETYQDDGQLNKAAIASFLLASENNARAIDRIVHPAVASDFTQSGAEWMECAILYESGFDNLVDKIIAVSAPDELRIQRVMQRDGISREKVLEWMKRQLPQNEILRRADHEIKNDGIHNIDEQLEHLLDKLEISGNTAE